MATEKDHAIPQRLKETREAAAAVMEDLAYFRSLLDTEEPEKADLRRSSGVLRRLLIDGDLNKVAAPRIGRIHLQAPDNKPVYVNSRKEPLPFFMSGGAPIFGIWLRCAISERSGHARSLPEFDPGRLIDLRLDSFCKQRILCFEGNWISRASVIKYVAHVSSGVHSGKPESDIEKLIDRLRHTVKLSLDGDTTRIWFNQDVFDKIELPIQYDPKAIDSVLFELFATIHFLVHSPDIAHLDAEIVKELVSDSMTAPER